MNLLDKSRILVEERVVEMDKAYMLQQSAYLPVVARDEQLQKLLQNENNPDFVALRLIKCAVEKSGVKFMREMQRHSVAICKLFLYKGHLDPLKRDALNKAV